jgi:hypothetical protein
MKFDNIETEIKEVDLKEYTREDMKKHIIEHNMFVKKQQELQELLKLPEELKLPKEFKDMGLELFGGELATAGQNRMAIETHLCHVVRGIDEGFLHIPDVNYEIDEIPCPSGNKHNHRIIKLWIDNQKTVIIDMIYIPSKTGEKHA